MSSRATSGIASLFEQPVDEAKLFPPDERLERAKALLARNAVPFARCEPQETRKTKKLKTPDGPITREIVYRDWRVTGNVATEKTEIVVGDSGRIIFGTCSCAFFQDNLLGKGPCEHMIALFKASADGRKDLPTSTASSCSRRREAVLRRRRGRLTIRRRERGRRC